VAVDDPNLPDRWSPTENVAWKIDVPVVNDNDDQSFIAAYDKRSGAEVWRVNRDEGSNWTTPLVWESPSRTEIITAGTGKVRSYDVNGRLLWQLSGMSTIAVPTPFAENGLLYITSGWPGDQLRPVYAIRPGAAGDISLVMQAGREFKVLWKNSLNEMTLATPAVASGSLIVRTASKLYRIAKTGARP
jgi:hypothetical protein